jgi:hypothetical protein
MIIFPKNSTVRWVINGEPALIRYLHSILKKNNCESGIYTISKKYKKYYWYFNSETEEFITRCYGSIYDLYRGVQSKVDGEFCFAEVFHTSAMEVFI